jgi:hypothetical protein
VRAAAKTFFPLATPERSEGVWLPFKCLLVALLSLPACPRSRLPKPDGASVVVAPEPKEGEVVAVAEVEPNDTVSKAQHLLVAPAAPAAVAGAVAWVAKGRPDVDVYRIDLPGPDGGVPDAAPVAPTRPDGGDAGAVPVPRPKLMARIEVTPEATVAVKIEVIDFSGKTVLAAGGMDPGQVVSVPNLALGAQPPYVRVRRTAPGDAPGTYKIVFRVLPLDPGAEVEPDDTTAQANDLVIPGEAIGYLGWRKDQDVFRLPTAALAEGSVLAADLDPIPNVSSRLALVDAAGKKLSEAHGRRGERVALRNVLVPPGTAQLFLIATAEFGSNADQRYDVRVNAELPKPGAEAEPNDDGAHAQPVTDGTVQGYLARGDVDIFRYSVSTPVTVTAELALPERATAKLEISNESGVTLARGKPIGKGRKPLGAGLQVEAGTVLIRVVAGSGEGNPDDPYRLTVTSAPATSDAPPPPAEE